MAKWIKVWADSTIPTIEDYDDEQHIVTTMMVNPGGSKQLYRMLLPKPYLDHRDIPRTNKYFQGNFKTDQRKYKYGECIQCNSNGKPISSKPYIEGSLKQRFHTVTKKPKKEIRYDQWGNLL